MEIILNENSLVGQYENLYMFKEYLENIFIPFYHGTRSSMFYSKSDFYSRNITPSVTLHQFITSGVAKGMSAKQTLLRMIQNGHFWDLNSQKDEYSEYVCESFELFSDCIFEALERDGLVYSFLPSDFDVEDILVKKNGEESRVKNIRSLDDFKVVESRFSSNKIEVNSRYKAVVYKNEANHPPHFHIINKHGEKLGAYQLPFLERRDILIPFSDEQKLNSWIGNNLERLIELWNTVHDDRLINRIAIDDNYLLAIYMEDRDREEKPITIVYKGKVQGVYLLSENRYEYSYFPQKDIEMITSNIFKNMVKLEGFWKEIQK
ncbi:TPA: hypothetical protein ACGO0I_000121 [Streptococcus suis]